MKFGTHLHVIPLYEGDQLYAAAFEVANPERSAAVARRLATEL
jgi:diadenosine tetraphosphate (Ap4A) HIT family hydrolase